MYDFYATITDLKMISAHPFISKMMRLFLQYRNNNTTTLNIYDICNTYHTFTHTPIIT